MRSGEKTKIGFPEMMKEMPKMIMKTINKIMKIKMPEQMEHRQAGCATLLFKNCFLRRRVTT